MGYADISCYGRKDYSTPNIDKLASQGMRFMNAYSGAPICTPTRVSFMTGRYPARTEVGLFEPLRGSRKDSLIGLRPEQSSVATLVKKAGYETALIGKWHLGFLPQHNPNANGFMEFFGCHSGAVDYISHVGRARKPDFYHNATAIQKEGYFADLLTEQAVQYLKKKHSRPFFLKMRLSTVVAPEASDWTPTVVPRRSLKLLYFLPATIAWVKPLMTPATLTRSAPPTAALAIASAEPMVR